MTKREALNELYLFRDEFIPGTTSWNALDIAVNMLEIDLISNLSWDEDIPEYNCKTGRYVL